MVHGAVGGGAGCRLQIRQLVRIPTQVNEAFYPLSFCEIWRCLTLLTWLQAEMVNLSQINRDERNMEALNLVRSVYRRTDVVGCSSTFGFGLAANQIHGQNRQPVPTTLGFGKL